MTKIKKVGHFGRMVGLSNRLKVYEFLQKHPDALVQDVSSALGLNRRSVGPHIWAIREGWRPQDSGVVDKAQVLS